MKRASRRVPAILFAEVPNFYAAVERAADAGLRARPLLVGGDPNKRGRVQSASPDALSAGVAPGLAMREALVLCPQARRVPTDIRRYREAAGVLCVCLRKRAGEVEPAGLGAAYLEAQLARETSERLATGLVEAVRKELGLPLRVGIAPVKFLARLLAEDAAAGEVRVLAGAQVRGYLNRLPLARLPRVGPRTLAQLEELGATTAGELCGVDRGRVEQVLGNHGLAILELAGGRDRAYVRMARHPASIGRASRLAGDVAARSELAAAVRSLARKLAIELQRQGLCARRVALRLDSGGGALTTRSITLGDPIVGAEEIEQAASSLLERVTGTGRSGLVRVAIRVAGLAARGEQPRQPELFPPGRDDPSR